MRMTKTTTASRQHHSAIADGPTPLREVTISIFTVVAHPLHALWPLRQRRLKRPPMPVTDRPRAYVARAPLVQGVAAVPQAEAQSHTHQHLHCRWLHLKPPCLFSSRKTPPPPVSMRSALLLPRAPTLPPPLPPRENALTAFPTTRKRSNSSFWRKNSKCKRTNRATTTDSALPTARTASASEIAKPRVSVVSKRSCTCSSSRNRSRHCTRRNPLCTSNSNRLRQ
mmetsp:Transcript_37484/g.116813  ORF Transcript_37484/g.116813 Transcript_37484/m.116813 type:complete len:225 (-) Transcript_37484:228-902(-)